MSQELSFMASTNIKNLLGKNLVTDQFTAVFELVKNSYDADATEVNISFINISSERNSLIIEDDGIGMNITDIENKWMVIGTNSKKNRLYSDRFQRALNGDKGIGRFSVDRLGEVLKLESIKENSNEVIEMEFEWNKFEDDYGKIEDIKIPYSISPKSLRNSGVRLEIVNLRDEWSEKNIDRLITNLRKFMSPFSMEDNFKIYLNVPEFDIEGLLIEPFNLEEISSLWIEAEIPIEKQDLIQVKIVRDGIPYYEEYVNNYNFGPIKSKLYFFNAGEKVRFNKKMGISVKDFGNIRVYRDNFRIHPYGESFNDWLDLDRRKAQGYARFFGSRDIIGYVQIYKEHNAGIDAPTNRQGLIENEYTRELRSFILEYPIKQLEKYFFKKPKNETFTKSKKDIEVAVSDLRKVTKEIKKSSPETAKILKQITGVVEQSQKEQTKFVKGQEELLEVYKRVASKEILLHQIIHQALIKIEKVITVSHSGVNKIKKSEHISELDRDRLIVPYNNIKKLTENAKDYLKKARDHLIRKRKVESININSFIDIVLETFKQDMVEEKIKVNLEIPKEIHIKIDKNDLETIFDNFFSNAIKSLKKSVETDRQISIKVVENIYFVTLVFKDNGLGIPNNIRDRIFDPFFSTTESSGMGLSIVDEVVKENKGQLNLAINEDAGAEFQIRFRK